MAKYKFACPTCSQRIAYDENAFGRKIRCPNCKSIITIPVPEGASPAIPPPAAPPVPGTPPPPPAPGGELSGPEAARPVPGKPTAAAPAATGANSNKKLLIGIGAAVVLAVGVGAALMLKGGDTAPEPAAVVAADPGESAEPGADPGMEPATDDGMDASMEGMNADMAAAFGGAEPKAGEGIPKSASGADFSWVPEDAEFFLSLRPAQILESPLIGKLMESQPNAGQSLAAFEQMAGIGIADIEAILIAVSGLEKVMDGGLKNVDPSNPMAAQAAMMQAGQQMNEEQLLLLKTAKPIDLKAIPMLAMAQQQPVEFEGVEYLKMAMAPNAPPMVLFSPDETTIVMGSEARVRKAISTGGKGRPTPAEFELLPPDHHLAFVLSPSSSTLEKMKTEGTSSKMGEDPVGGLLARHMSGGGLALTSTDAGLGVQASMSGDDAAAATKIVAAMQESLDKIPSQFEAMKSSLPESLQAAAADLATSMTVSALDQAVEFTAVVPNDLFSEEGMGFLMGLAMTKMMEAGQSEPTMAGGSESPPTMPAPSTPPPATEPAAPKTASTEMKPNEPTAPTPAESIATVAATALEPVVETPETMPAEPAGGQSQLSGRMLRAWTMNVLNAGIPDEPVSGEVNNLEFRMDAALIENGVLILRKGSERSPTQVVEVHNIQRPGEALDGKKFELADVSGVNTPTVRMKWEDPKKLSMPMRLYDNSFAIKLEFGNMEDGKIPGKVFIAVPDGQKSYISGSFTAEVY